MNALRVESGCSVNQWHHLMVVPLPKFSKKEAVRAGEALRGQMDDPSKIQEYADVFRVAHAWRSSHILPMQRLMDELRRSIPKTQIKGITAARMKRMASIRKKLRRQKTNLTQIQDIGGCRAIVRSMSDLNTIIDFYRSGGSKHSLRNDTNYIDKPRSSGYRSHHFVFEYIAPNEDTEILNGRRVEIQLRTQLQHSWATAIEAIGLVTKQDLKAGEGDPDWLRLFQLMSADFMEAECEAECPDVPSKADRRAEIVDLNRKLKAISKLQNLKQAFRVAENYKTNSEFYLIKYDHAAEKVEIRGYDTMKAGNTEYARYSNDHEVSAANLTTVLVEVSGVENLLAAYPNYFGDVTLFTQNLHRSIQGSDVLLRLGGNEPGLKSDAIDLTFVRDYTDEVRKARRRKAIL